MLYDAFGNTVSLESGGSFPAEWHWNIVDPSKMEMGSINSTGADINGSNAAWTYGRTEYIPVTAGETLHFMWCAVYGYDSEKSFVGAVTQTGGIAVVPSGVSFIRATHYKAQENTMPEINIFRRGYSVNNLNYASQFSHEHGFPMLGDAESLKGFQSYLGVLPWHDKRIAVIGDSFSAPGVWQDEMCSNFGAISDNHSVSGGGWCTGRTKTTYELAQEITTDPDIILIVHGTNDIANHATIGSFVQGTSVDDYDEATFYGGVQKALTYIRNEWPDVPVYVGTTPAAGLSGSEGENYIGVLKELAMKYGCVYIETRPCGMAYPLVQNDLSYRRSASDGHPSTAGQHKIAKYMTDIMSGYMGVR